MSDVVDFSKLYESLDDDRREYFSATPYPYVIKDNFIKDDYVKDADTKLLNLMNSKEVSGFYHINAKVLGTIRFEGIEGKLKSIVEGLQSASFVQYLEGLTGVKGLIPDRNLDTGGYVFHKPGCMVNLHVDHRGHPYEPTWSRKVLLLLYFNKNWEDSYNGHLEFWDKGVKECKAKVSPLFNRCVIQPIEDMYVHGLPEPIHCEEEDARKALVLWYYVDEQKKIPFNVTHYYPRPSDKFSYRALIHGENLLLKWHYYVKRYLKIDDAIALSFISFTRKLRRLFKKV